MYIFKVTKDPTHITKDPFHISRTKLNIAFVLRGGIGDVILSYVYVQNFCKRMDVLYKISIFVDQDVQSIKSLLNEYTVDIYSTRDINKNLFDLIITFDVQFPEVVYKKDILQSCKSKFITSYIKSVEYFNEKHANIIGAKNTTLQQLFLLINKENRITGMDIIKKIGIDSDTTLNIAVPNNGLQVIDKYNLRNKCFITIQSGVDVNNKTTKENIRLWSNDSYEELVKKIKFYYPECTIVQLGIDKEHCKKINHIDIDLRGKTTFAETMALLKEATLHIDCECGMVHVRHFLCAKPSVVLFGPTSIKTKGYKENINIRSNICDCELCEWLIGDKWQGYCSNLKSPNICMTSITPDMVMQRIKYYFNKKAENANA